MFPPLPTAHVPFAVNSATLISATLISVMLISVTLCSGGCKKSVDSPGPEAEASKLTYATADACKAACLNAEKLGTLTGEVIDCRRGCAEIWSPEAAACLTAATTIEAAHACEADRYEETKTREAAEQGIDLIKRNVRASYVVEIKDVFRTMTQAVQRAFRDGKTVANIPLGAPPCKPSTTAFDGEAWQALGVSHDAPTRFTYGLTLSADTVVLLATGDVDCDERASRFRLRCTVDRQADFELDCGEMTRERWLE